MQASSYGEEDVDPEGGDTVMSDKVTYTFDELVSQVQVLAFCSATSSRDVSSSSTALAGCSWDFSRRLGLAG